MSWCDGHGLRPASLGSLGCGLTLSVALQLECERWYAMAVTLEGVDRTERDEKAASRSSGFECLTSLRGFDVGSCEQ
jgi:hypothetical protein